MGGVRSRADRRRLHAGRPHGVKGVTIERLADAIARVVRVDRVQADLADAGREIK